MPIEIAINPHKTLKMELPLGEAEFPKIVNVVNMNGYVMYDNGIIERDYIEG